MKTSKFLLLLLLPAFVLLANVGIAQDLRDTIVLKNSSLIICKVTKITDTDIEYKKEKDAEAIVYMVSKTKVKEIRLANGKTETITRDEMDMNPEAEIIDKRSAIKFHFFSPFFDHLALTYEKSIKMGFNLEGTVGLINNSMFNFGVGSKSHLTQGVTLVLGPKFILGHSFYIKGMKYSHPLKGGYFKPEIILTSFAVRNITYTMYSNNYPYPYSYANFLSDMRVKSASLLITYGNQFIIGNTFTFGFNFGFGYSLVKSKYTNSALNNLISQSSNNYYIDESSSYYLYNQVRLGDNFPLVLSSSITLGYIFK